MFEPDKKNLLLMRHAQADLDYSVNLSFYGLFQSIFLVKFMKENNFAKPDAVLTGCQIRNQQTARLATNHFDTTNIPIFTDLSLSGELKHIIKSALEDKRLNNPNFLLVVGHENLIAKYIYQASGMHERQRQNTVFLISGKEWANIIDTQNISIKKIEYNYFHAKSKEESVSLLHNLFNQKFFLSEKKDPIPEIIESLYKETRFKECLEDCLSDNGYQWMR